ncbi:AraC family ligand binding domain-containing protein [Tenacibaculum sp. Bg11-29]|uniref:AraC family ligand binding domain-containing protein n=1 Tax=Tenacibaculum sp. Bg11-29 TaxID=2058306 RepID=UPI0018E2C5EA|nr:AraC family ligand binding domain-containing protein [Tenacibaculum sp. Bg11-29]
MKEGLHRHNFFFLMILEQASRKHHIDFKNYHVVSNTIFIIPSGQVHELILEQGSKGYLITFYFSFYSHIHSYKKEVFQRATLNNLYHLDNEKFTKILAI